MSPRLADLRRLLTHSGVYLIANLVNRGGAFVLIPLYTRHMSVTEYGALELLYSFTLMITVLLSAGMSHATLRFYFEYHNERDRHEVITTNFAVTFLLGLAGTSLLMTLADPVCTLLFDSTQYKAALLYALLVVLFSISSEILLAFLRAIENSWLYLATSAVKFVVQVTLSLYLLLSLRQGVNGVMAANLASVFVVWLILVLYSVRYCGYRIDLKKIDRVIAYSLPFFLSSILGVVSANMDRFFLNHYLSLAQVGIYGLGTKFGVILSLVVSEPFFRAYGAYRFTIMESENAREIQALVLKCIFALALCFGLAISLFSSDLIRLMAKDTYLEAFVVVPFIVLGYAFSTASYCLQTGILYQKQSRLMLYISICSLCTSLLLNFLLVPAYGALGAAISFTLVKLVESVVTNLISQTVYPIRYDLRALSFFLVAAVGIFAASTFLGGMGNKLALLTKIALVPLYLGLVAWLDGDIRQLFGKLLDKLGPVRALLGRSCHS